MNAHTTVNAPRLLALTAAKPFDRDPNLLFIECLRCGRPLNFDPGMVTAALTGAGVDLSVIDLGHMIVTDGCPHCSPDAPGYPTELVRLNTDFDVERYHMNAGGVRQ